MLTGGAVISALPRVQGPGSSGIRQVEAVLCPTMPGSLLSTGSGAGSDRWDRQDWSVLVGHRPGPPLASCLTCAPATSGFLAGNGAKPVSCAHGKHETKQSYKWK